MEVILSLGQLMEKILGEEEKFSYGHHQFKERP